MPQQSLQALEPILIQHFFDLRQFSDQLRTSTPSPQRGAPATDCPICMDTLTSDNAVLTKCGHMFHQPCVDALVDTRCPYCRANFRVRDLTRVLTGLPDCDTIDAMQGVGGGRDIMQDFANGLCSLSEKLERSTRMGDLEDVVYRIPSMGSRRRGRNGVLVGGAVVGFVFCMLLAVGYSRTGVWNSERCSCGMVRESFDTGEVIETLDALLKITSRTNGAMTRGNRESGVLEKCLKSECGNVRDDETRKKELVKKPGNSECVREDALTAIRQRCDDGVMKAADEKGKKEPVKKNKPVKTPTENGLVLQGVVDMIAKIIHGSLTGIAWMVENIVRKIVAFLTVVLKRCWAVPVYVFRGVRGGVVYMATRFLRLVSWAWGSMKARFYTRLSARTQFVTTPVEKELVLQGVVDLITNIVHGLLSVIAWTVESAFRRMVALLRMVWKGVWAAPVYAFRAVRGGGVDVLRRLVRLVAWVWGYVKMGFYMRLSVPMPVVGVMVLAAVVAVCNMR